MKRLLMSSKSPASISKINDKSVWPVPTVQPPPPDFFTITTLDVIDVESVPSLMVAVIVRSPPPVPGVNVAL